MFNISAQRLRLRLWMRLLLWLEQCCGRVAMAKLSPKPPPNHHTQITSKSPRNHPQTIAKPSPNHPQTTRPKPFPNLPQAISKPPRNHSQTIPKLSPNPSPNHPQPIPQSCSNLPQTIFEPFPDHPHDFPTIPKPSPIYLQTIPICPPSFPLGGPSGLEPLWEEGGAFGRVPSCLLPRVPDGGGLERTLPFAPNLFRKTLIIVPMDVNNEVQAMGWFFKTPCARPARGPQAVGRIGPKGGFPQPFFAPSPCACGHRAK